MKRLTAVLLAVALMTPAMAAVAIDMDNVLLSAPWVGTGDNRAIQLFDFGNGVSFAFGYKWEVGQTKTSADMLQALNNSVDGLEVVIAGGMVQWITYQGHTINSYPAGGPVLAFPCIWISGYEEHNHWNYGYMPDTPGDGINWIDSDFGASERVLHDGYFDCWLTAFMDLSTYETWPLPGPGGYAPPVPMIPEPATMSLLAVAALGLLKRRAVR